MTHFETPSRAILKPEYASNAGVQPPYKWAHLSPTTVDAAIAEIWGNGGQWPRHFYDMGYSKDRKVYNWVLKWLLWHVCRYRDWRNRRARNGSSNAVTNNETAAPRAADGEPVDMYNINDMSANCCSRHQHNATTRLLDNRDELMRKFLGHKLCQII